jgi:molecular chaperone DnaK
MHYFGIDFGTTNTAGIMLQEDHLSLLGDDAGRPLPSIVSIEKGTGKLEAGRHVWDTQEERIQSGHEIIVHSIKTHLGKGRTWQVGAAEITAEDIAAKIFQEISRQAARRNAPPLQRAAVTIPIGFPASARAELRGAAAKAGIEVSTFVHEPTAALIRFYPKVKYHSNVAVFDWGGGTLDISVMHLERSRVEEVATTGLPKAGDLIDDKMARTIHEQEMGRRGSALAFEEVRTRDRDLLRTRCEVAKCEMATRESTEILVYEYAGKTLDFVVTRSWFDTLVAPFVEEAIEQLTHTIAEAKISTDELGALIIIGGTSKLNLLQERLLNDARFFAALEGSNTPDWDVAHGAAMVDHLPGGYEISEAVGLVLSDGEYYQLVRSGDRVQAQHRTVSLALVEDVPEANIVLAKLRQGAAERERETVLRFSVPSAGFDGERIALSYCISPDLVLNVRAKSETRGDRYEVEREYEELRFAYRVEE